MGLCFLIRILDFSLGKVATFDELKREEVAEDASNGLHESLEQFQFGPLTFT